MKKGATVTTVYTIGYQRKPLATFIGQLREVGVDALIDVRLRNTSHLAGYTKRDDLAFLLREGFGIAYEHHPELAPTAEILDAHHADGDWRAYENRFAPLLVDRAVEKTGREILNRFQAPCLMCSESTPEQCHRRLIVEYWAVHLPELTITHL